MKSGGRAENDRKKKLGRPPYEITPEILKKVEDLAALGRRDYQICIHLGWSHETLCKKKRMFVEFAEAIKKGRERGISAVTQHLIQQSKEGTPASTIFYLKNRDKDNWKDKPQSFPTWDYDKSAPHDVQVQQILTAASNGIMPYEAATSIISALSSSLRVEEQTILRQEFEQLKREVYGERTSERDKENSGEGKPENGK